MTGSMLALTPFQFRLRRNHQLSDVKPALELEGLLARLVLRERRAEARHTAPANICSRSADRVAGTLTSLGQARVIQKCLKMVKRMFDPYRPELHYMRGPGPKWHEKHGRRMAA